MRCLLRTQGVLYAALLLASCAGDAAPAGEPNRPDASDQLGTGGVAATGGAPAATSTGGVPEPPPPEPDAGMPDTGDATPPPDVDGPYTCTLVIGINATAEWYEAGFENHVDNAKWELIRVHSGFVQLWADPNNDFWDTTVSSACAENPSSPDRVIFVALNFDYTELSQWLPNLEAVVANVQDKYASVKRIELMTFVRAPGNQACPQKPANRSTIHASQDEAIEMVVAGNPTLLKASPKFEVRTCSDFTDNPPHFTTAGAEYVAEMIADHYGLGQ